MLIVTIWPLFALICLGFLLSRRGWPAPEFWPAAERINYHLLFPALLLSSLASAPIRDPAMRQLGGAAVATILVACLLLALARRLRPTPAHRFGAVVQGVVRFNTYLGLAVIGALGGPRGLQIAAVLLAVAVPLVNLVSILALTEPGSGRAPAMLARRVLGNPLIIACLLGIALALAGTGLPFGGDAFLTLLAQASLPLGLFSVGAALKPEALRGDGVVLAAVGALRLLAMPLLAMLMARLFGLGAVETLVLVVFSAIPTAPTAYVLTRQLGGDGALMAGLVTAQTLAAAATIPLVLLLL